MNAPTLIPNLKEALTAHYNKPRTGVHVSDIIICPRQTVFRRLQPVEVTPTEIGFFTRGEGTGGAIQWLAASNPSRYTVEKPLDFFGLEAHIDLYDEVDDYPIEVKTYAGAKMAQPKPHYVEQIKAYMAITGKKRGLIFVQLMQQFKDWPFVEFPVYMDDLEIAQRRKMLYDEAQQFKKALDAKNPALARHIIGNNTYSWKCNSCPYIAQCQEMNKAVKA